MSKTWGKIGAWAADSEAAEAEELAAAAAPPADKFPSLREATATKQKKKNKISLQQFNSASSGSGLTSGEMFRLPTGPKERSPEEMSMGGRLGGGFSSYGRDRDGGGGGRRSYGGGFEQDDRRASGPPRGSEMDNFPSRADEADNWAMGKKSLPSFDSGSGRPNRYGSMGQGGSRADDVDSWGAGKRVTAPAPAPGRSTFGSGFRDPGPGGSERPRLVLEPKKKEVLEVAAPAKSYKPNPFGAARPREEVLAEKGLDWKKMEMDIEAKKTSGPSSASSSRPTSSQSNRSEGVGMARPKVNPFGDAKPREVLLQEKGLDWRKIDLDLDHRRVDRPETEREKILKEEIDHLQKEFAKQSAGATADLHDIILSKERELELLIRELNDQVRFVQRPGSGAGRVSRPPSRSESFEESRNTEFMERPRSRGTGDVWNRQGDDRRSFRGGMDRGGFVGNRGMDRPRSRERW